MVLLFRTSLGVSSSENSYDGTELQRTFPIRPHFTVRHVVVISMDVIVRRRLLYADGQETEEKRKVIRPRRVQPGTITTLSSAGPVLSLAVLLSLISTS